MSYSVGFTVKNAQRARELVDDLRKQPSVPVEVIGLLRSAIDGIARSVGEDKIIFVHAQGHHSTGKDSPYTDHKIEVKPITVME